jgi:predicted  nucleic acid-binding Zn-ribbon protein
MTAILFDTLKLSRTLRDKGHFTPEQAEDLAEALTEASQENLATKSDISDVRREIAELRAELKTEIAELRAELKTDIAGLRSDTASRFSTLQYWLIGVAGLQTIAIIGAIIHFAK